MKRINFIVSTAFLLLSQASLALSPTEIVKETSAGICHPQESPYYNRIKNPVRSNETLEVCMKRPGNRLPRYLQEVWVAMAQLDAAIESDDKAKIAQATTVIAENSSKNNNEVKNVQRLGGLRFGLGVGISFLGDQIDEARIIDGTVVATKTRSNQARVILETHKFMWGIDNSAGEPFKRDWAFGPFLAASLADDQGQGLLTAYGIGLMAGFRDQDGPFSWNIGVGWFVDTEVKQFRSGISDGMITTIQNDSDLLRTVDEEGLMIMISGSW